MWCVLQAAANDAPRRTFFDLGMNGGQDTFPLLRAGLRVVAVEANPFIVHGVERAGCRRSVSKDPTPTAADLVIVPRAVDSRYGENTSFCATPKHKSSRVVEHGTNCTGRQVNVTTTTCAALILEYGRPWAMKLDIEGKEVECIDSVLSLPDNLLPDTISFESPLRQPTKYRTCNAACVATFLRVIRAMAASGYVSWKRQWWRFQGNPGVMADEVRDQWTSNESVWVDVNEVAKMGCGFFNVSDAATMPIRAVRGLRESTGCDLHARRVMHVTGQKPRSAHVATASMDATPQHGPAQPRVGLGPLSPLASRLLHSTNKHRRSPWQLLCQGGAAVVAT